MAIASAATFGALGPFTLSRSRSHQIHRRAVHDDAVAEHDGQVEVDRSVELFIIAAKSSSGASWGQGVGQVEQQLQPVAAQALARQVRIKGDRDSGPPLMNSLLLACASLVNEASTPGGAPRQRDYEEGGQPRRRWIEQLPQRSSRSPEDEEAADAFRPTLLEWRPRAGSVARDPVRRPPIGASACIRRVSPPS